MKFIFADSLDVVDPDFDFESDSSSPGHVAQRDGMYPHEILARAPYDGILVSRGVVGSATVRGKYSHSQVMCFQREGARKFLRYPETRFPGSIVMGDCGAFSYRAASVPPYTPADMAEFYADGQFTHGCSVDHLIFDFDAPPGRSERSVPRDVLARYQITLENARAFLLEAKHIGKQFTPLGVIQGWSPESMASAATSLKRMGYSYLAIGGMVPLSMTQIGQALCAVREALGQKPKLHLLGFGKIESVDELVRYGVASFDTTSPILRAFKDARKNYFSLAPDGSVDYYTAIRIPHATESNKMKATARRKGVDQESMRRQENQALVAVRDYAAGKAGLEEALISVMDYWAATEWKNSIHTVSSRATAALKAAYRRTLGDRPWERCGCKICKQSGVETVIFRCSNRNKRRGIHNLAIVHQHLNSMRVAA